MSVKASILTCSNFYRHLAILFAFIFIFIILIHLSIVPNSEYMQVQGDGLFEEKLPPASLGDRQIALSTKIYPPLLTNQTSNMQKSVQFSTTEVNLGNKTIPHVYYFITVTKDNNLLMKELFHSHSGNMTLNIDDQKFSNTNGGEVNVLAAREPIMGAWTSNNTKIDNITIQAPILNEGGLYSFKVEILGIDNDTNVFKAINSLEYDSRLSIGNVYHYDIDYQDTKSNVSIISYYDSIRDFSHSPADQEFRWYMPFNWDINRLEKDQNILVHNEIEVPRNWFSESENKEDVVVTGDDDTASDLAIGKVNDQQLTGRSFVTDPFSSEDTIIFHYILDKNYLVNLARNQNMLTNSTSGTDDNSTSEEHIKFELQQS